MLMPGRALADGNKELAGESPSESPSPLVLGETRLELSLAELAGATLSFVDQARRDRLA